MRRPRPGGLPGGVAELAALGRADEQAKGRQILKHDALSLATIEFAIREMKLVVSAIYTPAHQPIGVQ